MLRAFRDVYATVSGGPDFKVKARPIGRDRWGNSSMRKPSGDASPVYGDGLGCTKGELANTAWSDITWVDLGKACRALVESLCHALEAADYSIHRGECGQTNRCHRPDYPDKDRKSVV